MTMDPEETLPPEAPPTIPAPPPEGYYKLPHPILFEPGEPASAEEIERSVRSWDGFASPDLDD